LGAPFGSRRAFARAAQGRAIRFIFLFASRLGSGGERIYDTSVSQRKRIFVANKKDAAAIPGARLLRIRIGLFAEIQGKLVDFV